MDNNNFTNEEIWNFLKNKMEKNGLTSKVSIVNTHIDDYPNNKVEIINAYYESDVINAIATAYRSGYERAMKGRPFKIDEKKKKGGHWEPWDENKNYPEGARIKYARPVRPNKIEQPYDDWGLKLGCLGKLEYSFSMAGIVPDNWQDCFVRWFCFVEWEYCFDVWVEDDE